MRYFMAICLLSYVATAFAAVDFKGEEIQLNTQYRVEEWTFSADGTRPLSKDGLLQTFDRNPRAKAGELFKTVRFVGLSDSEKPGGENQEGFAVEITATKDSAGQVSVAISQAKAQWKDHRKVIATMGPAQVFVIKNMASIDWTVYETDKLRRVVKIVPEFHPEFIAQDIETVEIGGDHLTVFDSKGRVWADSFGGVGAFLGIQAPQVGGALSISFKPFAGAKELGYAEDGRIALKSGDETITIVSSKPFLSRKMRTKVYGLIKLGTPIKKAAYPTIITTATAQVARDVVERF